MNFGVIYLLTAPQHIARLVVSIYSLRKYYDGPITLFTTREESSELTAQLLADDRLRIDIATIEEAEAGDNSAYVTKTQLLPQTPYDATLFMDADTLVVGKVDELIDATRRHPLVVTGFCYWTTHHRWLRRRLEKWIPLVATPGDKFDLGTLLELSTQNPLPVINVGVFGYHRDSAALAPWRELAEFGKDTFLPDEMALQILLPRLEYFLLSTKYNCSPAFMENPTDIHIWHFVAKTHLWHDESREIWQRAYEECRAHNVANICKWSRFEQEDGEAPEHYKPANMLRL